MPLPRRPRVRLFLPSENTPGSTVRAEVELDSARPVAVEFVHVEVVGTESSGALRRTFFHRVARLVDDAEIRLGTSRLPFTFALPSSAPPSYSGPVAHVRYDIAVHVSIPWWPDRRARFAMQVVPMPVATPSSRPGLYSTNPDGPRGSEAHAELSLASHHARPGGGVAGALALRNVDAQRYTRAVVGLRCAQETRGLFGVAQHPGILYSVPIDLRGAPEGAAIPFRFRVPLAAIPSLGFLSLPDGQSTASAVRWLLEASVGVRYGADLKMQIGFDVLPRDSSPQPALAPVPVIGEDRRAAVWEQASTPLGFVYAERAATIHVGDTEVSVARESRGREGTFLRTEVRYPELHLDLHVEPASWTARTLRTGVLIGDEPFDAAHRVDARDPDQVSGFLRELLDALAGQELSSMDDTTAVLETKDGGGDRIRLTAVLARAKRVAEAIEAARRKIPPPTGTDAALDEWRALATAVGGTLETARLRIDAEMMNAQAMVRFESVSPPRTLLRFLPAARLDVVNALHASGREALDAAADAHARTDLGDLFRMVVRDIEELRIDEGVSVGFAGVPGLSEGAWSAPDVQRRLELMARLARRLGNESGPYR